MATVGVLGGAYYAYQAYKNHNSSKLPDEWTEVGTLEKIWTYPVKSCGPVELAKAECSILGLKDSWLRDR